MRRFSPFTMWIIGIKLRSQGLPASCFACSILDFDKLRCTFFDFFFYIWFSSFMFNSLICSLDYETVISWNMQQSINQFHVKVPITGILGLFLSMKPR